MGQAEQIRLKTDEQYRLRLHGRGAAGYTWSYAIGGSAGVVEISIDLAADEPARDSEGFVLPGSSRDEVATVRGLQPGQVTVEFTQRRPWEPQSPPLEAHRLIVQVHA